MLRQMAFEDLTGERLINAETAWLLVNPDTHHILKPSAFPYGLPVDLSELDEQVASLRIKPEGQLTPCWTREIRFNDIDCNHHVNNAVYADILTDALPVDVMSGRPLCGLELQYQAEARLGDQLEISVEKTEFRRLSGARHAGRKGVFHRTLPV